MRSPVKSSKPGMSGNRGSRSSCQAFIGMTKPTALLAGLPEAPGLREVAEEVEMAKVSMIEQAK
jgi:hypothetical protein